MSNMPNVNKRFVNSLLPLELIAKIRSQAKARKMTTTEFIVWVLDRELASVELSSADYQWIADEVRKNENKRKAKTGAEA